jgi:hypothetical protein
MSRNYEIFKMTVREWSDAIENRCIIRPDDDGTPDDIVIDNVTLFRAERMDKHWFWMACYFGDGTDRISFGIYATKKGKIKLVVEESPTTRNITDDSKPRAISGEVGE